MEKRICNVLNELTVEEFLAIYSESIQDRMAELVTMFQTDSFTLTRRREHAKENKNIT